MNSKENILTRLSLVRQSKRYNLCFCIFGILLILSITLNYFLTAQNTYSISIRWIAMLYLIFWGLLLPGNMRKQFNRVCPLKENIKFYILGDFTFLVFSIIILPIEYLISSKTGIITIPAYSLGLPKGTIVILQFCMIFLLQVTLNTIFNHIEK